MGSVSGFIFIPELKFILDFWNDSFFCNFVVQYTNRNTK